MTRSGVAEAGQPPPPWSNERNWLEFRAYRDTGALDSKAPLSEAPWLAVKGILT